MLQEFWATTRSGGVYHISMEENRAVVKKVDKLSSVPDSPVGTILTNGRCVAITKDLGLVMYDPRFRDGKRISVYEINTNYWGGHSSPIVGLFSSLESARQRGYYSIYRALMWEPLCLEDSRQIINQIPDDHPCFVIDPPVKDMFDAVNKMIQNAQNSESP